MTIHTTTKLETQHPPLARDAHGNLVAIPNGTSSWRICRETTGRPKEIRGPDKQPLRFPLETTGDELVEMCGCGVYRVYALDEVGEQLVEEHIARWELPSGARDLRNGTPDPPVLASLRASTPQATDLRFALEAMTQMMRTNSDALRIVSESHVDLAKTIALAKGLPRNGTYVLAQPTERIEEEDDEEDEEPSADKPRHFVELLMPFAEKAVELVPGLVAGKMLGGATGAASGGEQGGEDLANRPNWEARDLVDLNYASRKAAAKRAAKEQAATRATAMASMQARIAADPRLMQHIIAIKGQLAADEIETLMRVLAGTSEAEHTKFVDGIQSLPIEGAVAFCREVIRTIRAQQAASGTSEVA